MFMGKEMILAIFIIPIALGAIAENQILAVLLRSPANRTLMHMRLLFSLLHASAVNLSAMYLPWGITTHFLHAEEENQEISQGNQCHHGKGRNRDNACLNQGH